MKLTSVEQRAAVTIAGIYGLRMLGLFLVMPVLVLYARGMVDYSAALAGLAVGIYGLGQALFQIPLGYLSDRIGRKPIIIAGLLIFALGSYIAATSETVIGLVIGRAIQGTGAIASTLMAFVSDLSRPEVRSKLMAGIGATIGVAFVLSMVLGPWLTTYIGVDGLFYLTAVLSLVAIAVVIWLVPAEQNHSGSITALPVKAQLAQVFANSQLQLMNLSIFVLHLLLTAIFVVIPGQLLDHGIPLEEHSIAYLVLMVISFVIMIPLMIWTEKNKAHSKTIPLAVCLLLIAMLSLSLSPGMWLILSCLGLFFIAFNFLEASIPSMVSRICGTNQRGTAMGFYSTSQFAGAFLGGLMAGLITQYFDMWTLFICLGALVLVWLLSVVAWLNPLED